MDDATKQSLLQILCVAMSDISETCWAAGWMAGCEDHIPELCIRAVASGVPQKWGRWHVTPEQARGLCWLAQIVESWADQDAAGTGYVAHQPATLPAELAAVIEPDHTIP